jgi:undecaprenyl-diphosphatase
MAATNLLNSIVAGTIQGVSELFPVSSSGHLLIFSQLTNLNLEITEIGILHLGSFVAIIIGMWDKIKVFRKGKTLFNVVVATIPAAVVGYIMKDWVAENLGESWIIAMSLIFWGGILILIDQMSRNRKFETKKIHDITPLQAIIVGIGQTIAFIPGTSRSGIAMVSGIVSGIEPKTAIEFSFLSGLLLIPGIGIFSLVNGINTQVSPFCIAIATIVAATIGLVVIKFFRLFINKRLLTICGFYRIILGILVLLFV